MRTGFRWGACGAMSVIVERAATSLLDRVPAPDFCVESNGFLIFLSFPSRLAGFIWYFNGMAGERLYFSCSLQARASVAGISAPTRPSFARPLSAVRMGDEIPHVADAHAGYGLYGYGRSARAAAPRKCPGSRWVRRPHKRRCSVSS